jgi:hypothetical protein
MTINNEIDARIAQLNNVLKVQCESITDIYKEANEKAAHLVESNEGIVSEIEALYKSMSVKKGGAS